MAVLDRRTSAPPAGSDACRDLAATLSPFRHGMADPTTRLDRVGRGDRSAGRFLRGTLTPDGPATVLVTWAPGGRLDAETWGPGADWLLARVPSMIGDADPGAEHLECDDHPVVARAARNGRHQRYGASGAIYHEILPTVIEQRITTVEAKRQWSLLCRELGEAAPGPFDGLRLPPCPAVLVRQPSWWFHPLGIERKRAHPLIDLARHASKFWGWAQLEPTEAARMLQLIPGIGVWTTGVALGPALGDPDSVPVGDFHVKNVVGHALAGEARATDERMLELLEPYAGQRGRVVRWLRSDGHAAPKFGAKQRILPMARW